VGAEVAERLLLQMTMTMRTMRIREQRAGLLAENEGATSSLPHKIRY